MKKLLLTLALACAVIFAGNAQPRAIGVRLGYVDEFSYQHSVSNNNMLDMTLGTYGPVWNSKDASWVNATFMYDWVWNIKGGLNWYLGPGFGVGLGLGANANTYAVNVGGQIGLEYEFGIPLNLSLDYRPMVNVLGFSGDNWGNWYGLCLGIRYRF